MYGQRTKCCQHPERQLIVSAVFNCEIIVHKCAEKGVDPFWGIRQMSKYWEYLWKIQDTFWEAPNHLFWICGDTAYTNLPGKWPGRCTIGVIKPAFFFLPKKSGSGLGVPLYVNLGKTDWKKRSIINMGAVIKNGREKSGPQKK